jgi:AcrR family transcriptional regulator
MDEVSPRTAGVPVRADGRRSHEELLAAGRETLAEQGTDASLREVARRAGVSIATLYRHFPTREALLEALLRQAFDTLRAQAAELLAAPDPGQALVSWLWKLTAASARYDGLPASVMGALHDPGSSLHESCAGLGTAASDLLARAQRSGQIRADLEAGELLATVYAMAWAARQAPQTADAGDRFLELLVEGLAARPVEVTEDPPRPRRPLSESTTRPTCNRSWRKGSPVTQVGGEAHLAGRHRRRLDRADEAAGVGGGREDGTGGGGKSG